MRKKPINVLRDHLLTKCKQKKKNEKQHFARIDFQFYLYKSAICHISCKNLAKWLAHSQLSTQSQTLVLMNVSFSSYKCLKYIVRNHTKSILNINVKWDSLKRDQLQWLIIWFVSCKYTVESLQFLKMFCMGIEMEKNSLKHYWIRDKISLCFTRNCFN